MTAAAKKSDITTEDFARYEFKYLLNARQRAAIEEEVSHFMTPDTHVHDELNQAYFVRSMYFENAEATHYYEKTDGIRTRRKFRLRTYGKQHQPGLPIYLEEKGRHIERTYKHRVAIPPEHLELFGAPETISSLIDLYPGVELVERFCFDNFRRSLNPTILVDYLRHPYVSNYDMNFRITFDSQLSGCPSRMLYPQTAGNWIAMKAGYTVLEVKFFRRIPAWFHRIVQAHNMRRLSISKFCEGMEACGLAIDLS